MKHKGMRNEENILINSIVYNKLIGYSSKTLDLKYIR